MEHADETRLIRIVSDNPGITCKKLAAKLVKRRTTVGEWVDDMEGRGRVFCQKHGRARYLFTIYAAESLNISDNYEKEIKPKTVLELQMMFNRLYRGIAL